MPSKLTLLSLALITAVVFVVQTSHADDAPGPNRLAPVAGASRLHGPFEERECGACHEGDEDAPGPVQEGGDDLCFFCHDEIEDERDSAKVIHNRAGACVDCHNPHNSNHRKLLHAPFPEAFYLPFSRGAYGLCFSCHDDKLVTAAKTPVAKAPAATGFRDGQKNLHTVHVVRGDRGRSCRACHGVHTAAHAGLVHDDVAFGSHGWRLSLGYVKAAEGGSCAKTCHMRREYSRRR